MFCKLQIHHQEKYKKTTQLSYYKLRRTRQASPYFFKNAAKIKNIFECCTKKIVVFDERIKIGDERKP